MWVTWLRQHLQIPTDIVWGLPIAQARGARLANHFRRRWKISPGKTNVAAGSTREVHIRCGTCFLTLQCNSSKPPYRNRMDNGRTQTCQSKSVFRIFFVDVSILTYSLVKFCVWPSENAHKRFRQSWPSLPQTLCLFSGRARQHWRALAFALELRGGRCESVGS